MIPIGSRRTAYLQDMHEYSQSRRCIRILEALTCGPNAHEWSEEELGRTAGLFPGSFRAELDQLKNACLISLRDRSSGLFCRLIGDPDGFFTGEQDLSGMSFLR
jgi:hypothetical protein